MGLICCKTLYPQNTIFVGEHRLQNSPFMQFPSSYWSLSVRSMTLVGQSKNTVTVSQLWESVNVWSDTICFQIDKTLALAYWIAGLMCYFIIKWRISEDQLPRAHFWLWPIFKIEIHKIIIRNLIKIPKWNEQQHLGVCPEDSVVVLHNSSVILWLKKYCSYVLSK